jgi:hypothetical protein
MVSLYGHPGARARRSRLVLGVYIACTVLVFSFILFEVLDVDASDFPAPTQASTVKLIEPPHDLKRTLMGGDDGLVVPRPAPTAHARAQIPVCAQSPLASTHARTSRLTLPRAALPPAAPSV